MIRAMLNPKSEDRPSVHKLIQDKFIITGFCPDSLPDSAMACEPHFNHEQSICVYADQNGYSRETRSRSRANVVDSQASKATYSRRVRAIPTIKEMGNDDLRAPLHEMNNVEINDRARNVVPNEPRNVPVSLG